MLAQNEKSIFSISLPPTNENLWAQRNATVTNAVKFYTIYQTTIAVCAKNVYPI